MVFTTPEGIPWYHIVLPAVLTLLCIVVVRIVWVDIGLPVLRAIGLRAEVGAHRWHPLAREAGRPLFCNGCSNRLDGFSERAVECDVCGMVCHQGCAAACARRAGCKAVVGPVAHQWLHGNLPADAICSVCGDCCSSLLELDGAQCLWCRAVVHQHCTGRLLQCVSPNGIGDAVVRPNMFVHADTGSTARPSLFRRKVPTLSAGRGGRLGTLAQFMSTHHITDAPISPVVVMVNRKSGGQSGAEVVRAFLRLLHPLQVVDLADGISPSEAVRPFLLFGKRLTVLAAGGDGTAAWVMQELHAHAVTDPAVAILPLGTGNDLARVLQWGGGHSGSFTEADAMDTLAAILGRADRASVDVWSVAVRSVPHHRRPLRAALSKAVSAIRTRIGRRPEQGSTAKFLVNYMCVGVGAKIALEFHTLRQSYPHLFCSRMINKFWYSQVGGIEVLRKSCAALPSILRVVADGQPVVLPAGIEGITVLNINSYGGGADIWGCVDACAAAHTASAHDDGLLEVVAVTGSLHLARLQVGLSSGAIRLAQCRQLTLTLEAAPHVPMQIDGEPWMQACPCEISITRLGQVAVLRKR